MANLNIEYSTGYTNTSESNSNVPYRLKLYYIITKRTESSITFNIDVEVNYPTFWSSNGAWVKYLTNSRRCNPNVTTDIKTFYASTQSSYRNNNSWWLNNLTVSNIQPTDTTVKIEIGFSNTAHNESNYTYHNFYLTVPIGYTSIGAAGTPLFEKEWFTETNKISWSSGTNGTNNEITHYEIIIDKEFKNIHNEEIIDNGLNLNYTYSTKELSEGTKIKCKIRTYDSYGLYIDSGYSKISTKNISPTAPTIKIIKDNIEQTGNVDLLSDIKIGGSSDSGGIFTTSGNLEYCLNVDSIGGKSSFQAADSSNYIVLENGPLLNYVGQRITFSGSSSDGYSETKGEGIEIIVGKKLSFNVEEISQITLDTILTIKNVLIDNSFVIFQNSKFTLSASYDNINFYEIDNLVKNSSGDLIFTNILQKTFNTIGLKSNSEEDRIPIYFKVKGTVGLLSYEVSLNSFYQNIKHTIFLNKIDGVLVSEEYHSRYYNDIPVIKENFSVSIQSNESVQYPYTITAKFFIKTFDSQESYVLIKENSITFNNKEESQELLYNLNEITQVDKKMESMLRISIKQNNLETILSDNKLEWNISYLSDNNKRLIQKTSGIPFTISSNTKEVEMLPYDKEQNGYSWDINFNWNILNGTGSFILKKIKLFSTIEFTFNEEELLLTQNVTSFENNAFGENTDYDSPLAKINSFNINNQSFTFLKALQNNKNHPMEIFYTYKEAFLKRTANYPEGTLDLAYDSPEYETNKIKIYVNTYSKPTTVSNITIEKISN